MPLTRPYMPVTSSSSPLLSVPLSLWTHSYLSRPSCVYECVHATTAVGHTALLSVSPSVRPLSPFSSARPPTSPFFGRPALRMDTSRHRASSSSPFAPSLPPDEGAERGDSIAENGPARLMMAPSSPPVLRRRMDILPPRERSEHGNGVEPREGSYGMEEAKESLRRKAYSLACLLPRLPSSFPSDSLCLPSLTPSLTRSVSCFRAFQDAHTRSRSRSRCGRSFVTTPRSQRMGKGCQKLS